MCEQKHLRTIYNNKNNIMTVRKGRQKITKMRTRGGSRGQNKRKVHCSERRMGKKL